MQEVLVAGAGKIGALIACLLSKSGEYSVHLVDSRSINYDTNLLGSECANIKTETLDVMDKNSLGNFCKQKGINTIISCLPYFCNLAVAAVAREYQINYFDLTEDTKVTEEIKNISKGSTAAFVPQCGLAPGFISIAANDLIQKFDKVDAVLMRVGALPVHPNNALKYSLTWSTDGLINEYGNLCYGIVDGKEIALQPLEGLETIEIDGLLYEAFNTSGGLGSLADTYDGKVNTMNYKTLRYPGHCHKMRLLMNDLKLNNDRKTLKHILENAIPKTDQDVVLVYVAVRGFRDNELFEKTYVKKVYPQQIAEKTWSAIQITTAASACAAVDIVLQQSNKYKGLVLQEQFELEEFLQNKFGKYYN